MRFLSDTEFLLTNKRKELEMANISKYTRTHLGALFKHNNRKENDLETLSNKDIDASRTHLNYNIVENPPAIVSERLKKFYHEKNEALIVMAEVVLTLPKNVKKEDTPLFFSTAYDFYCNDFGKPNVVNAVVHFDETTPHMHLDFLPVKPIDDKISPRLKASIDRYVRENGPVEGRLCAKDVLNRVYYQHMHPRLMDAETKALGYPCEILNGATDKGNRTVLQMKNEKLAKELEVKQTQLSVLTEKMNYLTGQIKRSGFDEKYFSAPEIFVRMDILEKENSLFKQIIASKGIELPGREMYDIAEMRKAFQQQHFYFTEESFPDEYDGIRVIETFRRKPRLMPEWKYIESDAELEWIVNNAPLDITVYNNVMLFPTDDIGDTVKNLIYLKEHDTEYKKILFPQITNDKYNIAENILRQCRFDTLYQLRNVEPGIDRRLEIIR